MERNRLLVQAQDRCNDAEFESALNEMLATLKDPETRLVSTPAADVRVHLAINKEGEIVIARFEPGERQTAAEIAELLHKVPSGPVVFDLRDSSRAASLLPTVIPVERESIGPPLVTRMHSGYATQESGGSEVYESLWERHDGLRLPAAPNPIRPVYLVNSRSGIPMAALAAQNSGVGAIISEDPISDQQVVVSRIFTVVRNLRAQIRVKELAYADGTSDISANMVLHKTGDDALRAAIELARSGDWPRPSARPKLTLPPAGYVEKSYSDQPYPSAEYRMLAAARIWGVFHYFHVYRHLYDEDWDLVLLKMLPKMEQARNAKEYHRAVAEMVAHTVDSHCSVRSDVLVNEVYGIAAPPPIEVRWIENQPVVTRLFAVESDVRPGDVVVKIDGEPYRKRIDAHHGLFAYSTTQAMMKGMMEALLRGPDGSEVRISFRRGDQPELEFTFMRKAALGFFGHPRDGAAFRLITPKIGYVDLELLTNAQVDAMFDEFKNTEAIILDMRGYPQGTFPTIAPRLAEKQGTIAASFRRNLVNSNLSEATDLMSVGFEQRIPLTNKPRYAGKTVMLIDERAGSQSEHSGLFYRAANGTRFIGSPTMGVDGDVTLFTAPGGIHIRFSGHDVRWPDGTQLQRVGLKPDIEVRPTIAGIRDGSDEVLDRAIQYLQTGR